MYLPIYTGDTLCVWYHGNSFIFSNDSEASFKSFLVIANSKSWMQRTCHNNSPSVKGTILLCIHLAHMTRVYLARVYIWVVYVSYLRNTSTWKNRGKVQENREKRFSSVLHGQWCHQHTLMSSAHTDVISTHWCVTDSVMELIISTHCCVTDSVMDFILYPHAACMPKYIQKQKVMIYRI